MNEKDIYSNPRITDPKFLFVQLSEARNATVKGRRVVLVKFRVEPLVSDLGGTFIYANLYCTPASEKIWEGCRATFGFSDYDPSTAVEHWGKVYLVASHFQQKDYSTIQFVGQTTIDHAKVAKLARLSQIGGIPWDAQDADEAAEMVRDAAARAGHADDERFVF